MRDLRPFFVFLLSDFVARHQAAKPVDHAFATAIDELTRQTGLTMQERRILHLQLLGLGYEEIADTLNISLNTVRTHVRSIYMKTGAHGQTELFAKYFTPRIDSR
jgi:DNA-binding CsgD family transcriptional regulator